MKYMPMVQVTLRADHLTALYGYTHAYSTFFLDTLKRKSQENPTEDTFRTALETATAYIQAKNNVDRLLLELINTSLQAEISTGHGQLDVLFTEPEFNFFKTVIKFGAFNPDTLDKGKFTNDQITTVTAVIQETAAALEKGRVITAHEMEQIKRENALVKAQTERKVLGNTKVGQA